MPTPISPPDPRYPASLELPDPTNPSPAATIAAFKRALEDPYVFALAIVDNSRAVDTVWSATCAEADKSPLYGAIALASSAVAALKANYPEVVAMLASNITVFVHRPSGQPVLGLSQYSADIPLAIWTGFVSAAGYEP